MCDAFTAHESLDEKDEDLYDKYIIIDTEEKAVDNDMIPGSEVLAFSSPPWSSVLSEDGQQDFDNGIWQIHQCKDPWQRIIKETNNICIQEWHQYKGPTWRIINMKGNVTENFLKLPTYCYFSYSFPTLWKA